jgi:hypothetical protein
MTNPQFAVAVLILIAAIASFGFIKQVSNCRQTHGAGYSCFPPDNPVASRWGPAVPLNLIHPH